MAYTESVVFIETPIFFRRVQQYMDDDDYSAMQVLLCFWLNVLMPEKSLKAQVEFENCDGPAADGANAGGCALSIIGGLPKTGFRFCWFIQRMNKTI